MVLEKRLIFSSLLYLPQKDGRNEGITLFCHLYPKSLPTSKDIFTHIFSGGADGDSSLTIASVSSLTTDASANNGSNGDGDANPDNGEEDKDGGASGTPGPVSFLRVRSNLSNPGGGARGGLFSSDSPPASSSSLPSESSLQRDSARLQEEVLALRWLSQRKEREWERAVRLLKRKEAELALTDKKRKMAGTEAAEVETTRIPTLPVSSPSTAVAAASNGIAAGASAPKRAIIINAKTASSLLNLRQGAGGGGISLAGSQAAGQRLYFKPNSGGQPILLPATAAAALGGQSTQGTTRAIVLQKPGQEPRQVRVVQATQSQLAENSSSALPVRIVSASSSSTTPITATASHSASAPAAASTKVTLATQAQLDQQLMEQRRERNKPKCQKCCKEQARFVCSQCSKRWYCSRDCQIADWDEHGDECEAMDSQGEKDKDS